jgi:hypothetical protein
MDEMIEPNPALEALGRRLRDRFDTIKGERRWIEERWLQDLRQYKGIYEPEEVARIDQSRSHSFTRMTRIKVKGIDARLMDLLFPAGSEDNWAIEPTPSPDVQADPATLMQAQMALGRPLLDGEMTDLVSHEAKAAAKAMTTEIRDQLSEVRYRKIMREVIHSGNLYGTGVLKGPLVNRKMKKRWQMDPMTGQWVPMQEPVLLPYIEFTPVWDLYPDSQATSFLEARYCFQRNVLAKHTLLGLAEREDFDGGLIRRYIKEHREGDHQPIWWETQLRLLGLNTIATNVKVKRYEVLEYWGAVSAEDLGTLGLPLGEAEDDITEYWATVWLLGNNVIKAELQPIEGVTLPYYSFYFDKDETSIFGEGVPTIMRDDQKGLNAAIRAMMDNAAVCAGPQFEVNLDLLEPNEDPRAVYPFRVWVRSGIGAEAAYEAVKVKQLPNYTQELQTIVQMFMNNIHESTLPSYMHGEASSKGSVGRTVGGLSLLMSAAQFPLKDQLTSIDDDVLRPFLQAMYNWNMQFNPKPEIKGDFSVVVKGTSSLVAREIRAQNLEQFAQSTLNPYDAPFIDRLELAKQRAQVQELGEGIVRDAESMMAQQLFQPLIDQETHGQPTQQGPSPGPLDSVQGYGGNAGVYQPVGPASGGDQGPADDRRDQ